MLHKVIRLGIGIVKLKVDISYILRGRDRVSCAGFMSRFVGLDRVRLYSGHWHIRGCTFRKVISTLFSRVEHKSHILP